MKKRGVSPVIATVLLIALVTAAAAIVFLVVIPMLQPKSEATLIITPGSSDVGGGDRAIEVKVDAVGGSLNITSVTVTGLTGVQLLDTPTGSSMIYVVIAAEGTDMVYIVGAFNIGTSYDITLEFAEVSKTFSHTA
jgi:flagellin-like protein